jgi:hypothetical protein
MEARKAQRASSEGRNKVLPAAESIRSIGGLVVVVIGVLAVTTLAIVTMALIRSGKDANSMIPLATTAFGVISAVVGAYLGIKIGTDQSATFAQDANRAHAQLGALQRFIPEDQHDEAERAAAHAAGLVSKPTHTGA